ncbi:hypothetical protein [Mucilaginibacter kameinonensis]|uniref:hypothetical protein n=1 Tax=Mucilaginibacter kameinonensis TaxID=452286 RepID=UPI000EF78866|nr:hypothetical protein [Mucilaginibacter kameinonensis]
MKKIKPTHSSICLLTLLTFFAVQFAFAQNTVKEDPVVNDHYKQVKAFIANPKGTDKLITGYKFNDSLQNFLRQVSGVVLKGGQIQSISAIADDKSLTVNYALPIKLKWLSVQVSGTGTADKGIVNVFTGDKFGKTLTGGFNFNWFIWGSAKYPTKKREPFKYFLSDADDILQTSLDKADGDYKTAIADLVKFKTTDYPTYFTVTPSTAAEYKQHFTAAHALHLLLEKTKAFFPTDLDTTDQAKVGAFIDELNTNQKTLIPYVRKVSELKVLDSLQTAAPFSVYRFTWVSFAPKLNQTDYPIYDPNNAAASYTKTQSDYFFSATLSANRLWSYKKFKWMVYPGITVSNARVFDPADSLTVTIPQPLPAGVSNVQSIKSTGFYKEFVNPQWNWGVNLPFMFYWTKGYGIDIGTGLKFNHGTTDFNAHAGFFFSISAAKEAITIEPIIRYDDDKKQTYERNRDKFSFGLSLSLALPTFMSGGK